MAPKRKAQGLGLERRVKPRRADEWEENQDTVADDESDAPSEYGDGAQEDDDPEGLVDLEGSEEDVPMSDDDGPSSEVEEGGQGSKIDLSSVTFGALARAQESLQSSRKPKKDSSQDTGRFNHSQSYEPQRSIKPSHSKRTSKHAPQEQTSKRQVSRRWDLGSGPQLRHAPRDPRFDPVASIDQGKLKRNYAFLDEYRDSEIADLKKRIRETKDQNHKERMKRQLMSMESKKKTQKRKDERDEVLRAHKKQEKELVAQGKKPFYLKTSEQKTRFQTDRFSKMSKGQVDRAIERKRKKVAGKEKKELGSLVRVTDRG